MSGTEPVWLTEVQVKMLHTESLHQFGGMAGLRDAGLLQSALARPQHSFAYDEAYTLFDLAAAYGFGIARNHAFVDGNKRTALLAMRAFLFINGFRFVPEEVETVTMIEQLAAGSVDEATLAGWIQRHCTTR